MHAQAIVTCGMITGEGSKCRRPTHEPGAGAPSRWRRTIGGVLVGLALCSGCEGEEVKDCDLDSGILDVSIVLAVPYADSLMENFDDRMLLWIDHLDEEPATSAHCTQFPSDTVTVLDHSLDLDHEFEVPAGWICAGTWGTYTIPGDDGRPIVCYGYLPPVEVPGCTHVDAPITVTCKVQSYEGD